MKHWHSKSKTIITRLVSGKAKYVTVGVAALFISGSAFAYHATQTHSRQVQQEQASGTGDIPVSTASPNNLILVDPSTNDTSTGNQSGQSSSQPSQSSSSSSSGTPKQSAQSSVSKAGCNYYSDVAYNTASKPDSSLNVGKTKTVGGVNGSRKVCTDTQGNIVSNEVTYPAVDKTVYYGTYTSDDAMNDAQYACRAIYYDSSYHGDCVSSEMNKRGWYYQGGQWVAS